MSRKHNATPYNCLIEHYIIVHCVLRGHSKTVSIYHHWKLDNLEDMSSAKNCDLKPDTELIGANKICWSYVLLLLYWGSGKDETDDATTNESLELSQLKYASITPPGVPGIDWHFLLLVWQILDPEVPISSRMRSWHSSMLACLKMKNFSDTQIKLAKWYC